MRHTIILRPSHGHIIMLLLTVVIRGRMFGRKISQEEAPLEVGVRMNDSIELRSTPRAIVLDTFDILATLVVKDAITRDMISGRFDVVLDGP